MPDSAPLSRKLGLGTVQFGMAYGVANQSGRVSGGQLDKVMALARRTGLNVFDTAPGYGKSEVALSPYLNGYDNARVITKIPHFLSTKATEEEGTLLRTTFDQSLSNLRVDAVYGLLFHRGTDLLKPDAKRLWAELEDLKALHKVRLVGVSVYTPDELNRLLDLFPIDIVQLPMNILDQRFKQCGLLKQLGEAGIEVHVRSAFLQGVLLTEPEQLPQYFTPLRPHLTLMRQEAAKAGCSMLAMALNYALQIYDVDTVLVGVDSATQLQEILDSVKESIPSDFDWGRWAVNESRWLNPNQWELE